MDRKRKFQDDDEEQEEESFDAGAHKRARHNPIEGLNEQMHPRNRYRNAPDFSELAFTDKEFAPHLVYTQSGVTIDFARPESIRALTRALLARDFQLRVELPADKLTPTLPLRLNYIHWLEDLIGFEAAPVPKPAVRGVDVGTGASCIYPLLGARMNKWHFVASEIDASSVECAVRNVRANNLEEMINVRHVDAAGRPLIDALRPHERFDFTMCNPPFFANIDEHMEHPDGACTGSMSEMVTPGGEVAFVSRMIEDSVELRDRVRWFTSMLGKKQSVRELRSLLKKTPCTYVQETRFSQGTTPRWALAWSFVEHPPSVPVTPGYLPVGAITCRVAGASSAAAGVSAVAAVLAEAGFPCVAQGGAGEMVSQPGAALALHVRAGARDGDAWDVTVQRSDAGAEGGGKAWRGLRKRLERQFGKPAGAGAAADD